MLQEISNMLIIDKDQESHDDTNTNVNIDTSFSQVLLFLFN